MTHSGQRQNLDNAATTPVDDRVVKAMIPYFSYRSANPDSSSKEGRKAMKDIEEASAVISETTGCGEDVLFTSGASESNNWVVSCFAGEKRGVACGATEHASVYAPVVKAGGSVIKVLPSGGIDMDSLSDILKKGVGLVSVQAVNQETGAEQDTAEIRRMCMEHGALYHCDASQWFGKSRKRVFADFVTVSAHKIHGPKGIGALICEDSSKITPMILGGGQQGGLRAGTLNPALIVGFAKACQLVYESLESGDFWRNKITKTVEEFSFYDGISVNTPDDPAAFFLNFSVPSKAPEVISLMSKDHGIVLSRGSACGDSPRVLREMGKTPSVCDNSIRVSMGRNNRKDALDSFAHLIRACHKKAEEMP